MARGSLGSLKLVDTQETLAFQMNPTEYTLEHSIQYRSAGVLGSSSPVVMYQPGSSALLTIQLRFDIDLGDKVGPGEVLPFLKMAQSVQAATQCPPVIEARMGNFSFRGYLAKYRYTPRRFSSNADPVAADLEASLISDGTYERGGIE